MGKAWRSLGLIFAVGLMSEGAALAQATAPPSAATAEGQAMLQDDCTGCHDLEPVTARGRTPQEWSSLVDRMVGYGAPGSDSDIAAIKVYLAKTLPPGDSTSAAGPVAGSASNPQ